VNFYADEESGYYFTDLFYRDGYYYMFNSSDKSLKRKPYKHLLKFGGGLGNPFKDTDIFVLTNDNALTLDAVAARMISSDSVYIQNVPEHRIIPIF